MPIFFFSLQDGNGGVDDRDGVELPDLAAAREYAIRIARELMSRNETQRHVCRLDVFNSERSLVFDIRFAEVDPALDHLGRSLRDVVERLAESRRALAETVHDTKRLRFELNAARARAQHRPYLVAQHGRVIAPPTREVGEVKAKRDGMGFRAGR